MGETDTERLGIELKKMRGLLKETLETIEERRDVGPKPKMKEGKSPLQERIESIVKEYDDSISDQEFDEDNMMIFALAPNRAVFDTLKGGPARLSDIIEKYREIKGMESSKTVLEQLRKLDGIDQEAMLSEPDLYMLSRSVPFNYVTVAQVLGKAYKYGSVRFKDGRYYLQDPESAEFIRMFETKRIVCLDPKYEHLDRQDYVLRALKEFLGDER